jgi:hypothetical protein
MKTKILFVAFILFVSSAFASDLKFSDDYYYSNGTMHFNLLNQGSEDIVGFHLCVYDESFNEIEVLTIPYILKNSSVDYSLKVDSDKLFVYVDCYEVINESEEYNNIIKWPKDRPIIKIHSSRDIRVSNSKKKSVKIDMSENIQSNYDLEYEVVNNSDCEIRGSEIICDNLSSKSGENMTLDIKITGDGIENYTSYNIVVEEEPENPNLANESIIISGGSLEDKYWILNNCDIVETENISEDYEVFFEKPK